MKRIGVGILWAIGIYFVVRALAEPFVIDVNDPATYRNDWGGPHLAGVLLVHCGLGVIAAALMAWRLMRRFSKRLRRLPKPSGMPPAEPTATPPAEPTAKRTVKRSAGQRSFDVTRSSNDPRGSADDGSGVRRAEARARAA